MEGRAQRRLSSRCIADNDDGGLCLEPVVVVVVIVVVLDFVDGTGAGGVGAVREGNLKNKKAGEEATLKNKKAGGVLEREGSSAASLQMHR